MSTLSVCIVELLRALEQRGKDFSELERKLKELETLGPQTHRSTDEPDEDDERREEELTALHHQLTALLQAGEATGGALSAAQAAAELAGVASAEASGLHAQQGALAEARCRERFERRAVECRARARHGKL